MTNEELAMLIREGETEHTAELWEQVNRLLFKKANSFYLHKQGLCKRAGVELDDLEQVCYFAMLRAVQAYSSEKGFAFTSFINFHAKKAMEELIGVNRKKNPIDECFSLDAPVNDESESAYGEFIPDPDAEQAFESVDESETVLQLRALLDEILATLPERDAQALRLYYYDRLSAEAAGAQLGVDSETFGKIRIRALQKIRHIRGDRWRRLCALRDEIIGERAYHNTGLTSFEVCGGSSPELAVEFADDFISRYLKKVRNAGRNG